MCATMLVVVMSRTFHRCALISRIESALSRRLRVFHTGLLPVPRRPQATAVPLKIRRCVTVRGAKGAAGSKAPNQRYLCKECGEDYSQWYGQCPACKMWDSFSSITVEPASRPSSGGGGGAGARALARAAAVVPNVSPVDTSESIIKPVEIAQAIKAPRSGRITRAKRGSWVSDVGKPRLLSDVLSPETVSQRFPRLRLRRALGAEVERVLGGGVVAGALTLIGGDPGVGKSTLALQIAGLLGEHALNQSQIDKGGHVDRSSSKFIPTSALYTSGEENIDQLATRAERLGVDLKGVKVYSATRLEDILSAVIRERPAALVVDSIQTVFLEDATGSPGSVSQVRECATALLQAAKTAGMPVFIIGHVTKSGDIAGPRVLEHIVDVVLYLEGDADRAVRILRGQKNRFGSTDEVGVFEMVEEGLRPVLSPSALFMGDRILTPDVSSAPTVTVQGSRPFMLEVQALCAERSSHEDGELVPGQTLAPVVRTAVGFRPERLQLLLAVLAKFVLGRRIHRNDVFVNIVGGLKLEDPSTDVAVALAIASSFTERALPAEMAFFGEVGLGGELRPVPQSERRLSEAATMGFRRVVMPRAGATPDLGRRQGVEVLLCNTLAEAIQVSLGVVYAKTRRRGKNHWERTQ